MANIPILLAEADSNGQWRAWCPFCRKFHHHRSMEGIRAAHCHGNPDSPFRETGYILKRYPKEKSVDFQPRRRHEPVKIAPQASRTHRWEFGEAGAWPELRTQTEEPATTTHPQEF